MSFDTARILEEIQANPPAKPAKPAKAEAEISDISNFSNEGCQYYADFDQPEVIRRLDEEIDEYKDFPRYEAALRHGLDSVLHQIDDGSFYLFCICVDTNTRCHFTSKDNTCRVHLRRQQEGGVVDDL